MNLCPYACVCASLWVLQNMEYRRLGDNHNIDIYIYMPSEDLILTSRTPFVSYSTLTTRHNKGGVFRKAHMSSDAGNQ